MSHPRGPVPHQLDAPAHGQGAAEALRVLLPGARQPPERGHHRHAPVALAARRVVLQHLRERSEVGSAGPQPPARPFSPPRSPARSCRPLPALTCFSRVTASPTSGCPSPSSVRSRTICGKKALNSSRSAAARAPGPLLPPLMVPVHDPAAAARDPRGSAAPAPLRPPRGARRDAQSRGVGAGAASTAAGLQLPACPAPGEEPAATRLRQRPLARFIMRG